MLDVIVRGLLPAALVLAVPFKRESVWAPWRASALMGGLALLTLAVALLAFYSTYAPTFRNHRELRFQLVPSNYIGSALGVLRRQTTLDMVPIGMDAVRPATSDKRPLLVVLVVGETARADNFSLSGYHRPTNDALTGKPIICFSDVTSCGTDTATSIPCMFSGLGREGFGGNVDRPRENLLDVLQRTGVQVTWLDNNSGCKTVCDRVPTIKLRDQPCESGTSCFDDSLVGALEQQLDKPPSMTSIWKNRAALAGAAAHTRRLAMRCAKALTSLVPRPLRVGCSKESLLPPVRPSAAAHRYFASRGRCPVVQCAERQCRRRSANPLPAAPRCPCPSARPQAPPPAPSSS